MGLAVCIGLLGNAMTCHNARVPHLRRGNTNRQFDGCKRLKLPRFNVQPDVWAAPFGRHHLGLQDTFEVTPDGIEPSTSGLRVRCSAS